MMVLSERELVGFFKGTNGWTSSFLDRGLIGLIPLWDRVRFLFRLLNGKGCDWLYPWGFLNALSLPSRGSFCVMVEFCCEIVPWLDLREGWSTWSTEHAIRLGNALMWSLWVLEIYVWFPRRNVLRVQLSQRSKQSLLKLLVYRSVRALSIMIGHLLNSFLLTFNDLLKPNIFSDQIFLWWPLASLWNIGSWCCHATASSQSELVKTHRVAELQDLLPLCFQ